MVTEAGKELLRNTINTAKFHNRILEENEMWKQWELERGLTMMVSDDLILNKSKKHHHHHHQCSKHRKRSASKSSDRAAVINEKNNSTAGSSKSVDRWDHSGYRELYPDESDTETYSSSSTRDGRKKWHHKGYKDKEPYRDEMRVANLYSASAVKDKWKKWDHSGYKELYPDETNKYCSHTSASYMGKKWNHKEYYLDELQSAFGIGNEKWDHDKYKELYPDETHSDNSSPDTASNKAKKSGPTAHEKPYIDKRFAAKFFSAAVGDMRKKWNHKGSCLDEACAAGTHKEEKWDHSGYLELYPDETHKERRSTSKTKETTKKEKKKKRKHHREVSTSDNEIWEDFKTYKRSRAQEKSKSYDGHVKEWKKQSKRERESSKM